MNELFNYLYQKGEEAIYEYFVENFNSFKLKDIDIDVHTYAEVWVNQYQVSFIIWKKRLENCWEIYRTVRFHFSMLFSISTISKKDMVVKGELQQKKGICLSKFKKYLYSFMESEWVLDKEYKFRGFDEEQKPIFTRRYKGYISITGGGDSE